MKSIEFTATLNGDQVREVVKDFIDNPSLNDIEFVLDRMVDAFSTYFPQKKVPGLMLSMLINRLGIDYKQAARILLEDEGNA